MPKLQTELSISQCIEILREQVTPDNFWARCNIFRPNTSRVIGKVSDDSFYLESSTDRFSKRLVATLAEEAGGTVIAYEWKRGLEQRVFGHAAFDETEILCFLIEWLEAKPV